MKLGLLLIALGVGYKVYADASKEKGKLKSLGQWVGVVIMAVSLVTSAVMVYACWGNCPKMGFFGKGPCPFTQQPAVVQNK